jgi:sulfite reductase (NADPH) flavoprotein alpha-component
MPAMTLRGILFQIHWFLGITAGFVLAIMGVTGATMAFEEEIQSAISPGIVRLAPSPAPALSPDALIAAASRQHGGRAVTQLVIERDPARAASVTFAPDKGQRRGERSLIDPRTGALLGKPHGAELFETVERVHRWMALPGGANGWGRTITGIAALSLVFFALSGLYLRWPRRALDWRAWFVLDLRLTGRNLYRALHAVVGGWIFAAYLLSGITGLWWSYDWYRQGVRYVLTGKAGEIRREGRDGPPKGDAVPLAPAWAGFVGQVGADGYARVAITPSRGGKPVEMRVLPPDARFDRQTDTLRFDARDGRLVKADRYAARPWGETIVGNVLPLHTGAFFGLPGRIVMLLTSATMPLFTVTGLLLYLARRRRKRALAAVPDVAAAEASGETLVLYASQTGGAERLARLTAGALGATLRPLGGASAEEWRAAQRILFVAATYGEGEPPDAARGFAARAMARPGDLAGKCYAVLALGDREYADFCAFGHRIDAWAHDSGARRLFDMIEIDGADVDAEHRWQQQVFALAGGAGPAQSDWQRAPFAPWRLAARAHVNPGSPGAPMHRIVLEPVAQDAAWQPGAIAEVMPRHDPARVAAVLARHGRSGDAALAQALAGAVLPAADAPLPDADALRPLAHRDYSVASIAPSGAVELLVREATAADGGPGIASGWLTHHAAVGETVELRLRDNPGFAMPDDAATPMILIGNGTGLAGLMGLLRERARCGGGPVWLIHGERSPAHDRPFDDELAALRAHGTLARHDPAFSRDPDGGCYVQDVVTREGEAIRAWADQGAAIYVCGSLAGMAPGVDVALRAILGDAQVEAMLGERRYCRDIY